MLEAEEGQKIRSRDTVDRAHCSLGGINRPRQAADGCDSKIKVLRLLR
jgi:hypothetical protein